MKIIYKKGDVTAAPEKAVFHGCNAQGVMGSGVALAIKNKFPEAFKDYRRACVDDGLSIGDLHVSYTTNGVIIFNAITQDSYGTDRRQVDYEAVYVCLEALNRYTINGSLALTNIKAVAMPKFGAGLGGGNWKIIETMIEETSTYYQPVVYEFD